MDLCLGHLLEVYYIYCIHVQMDTHLKIEGKNDIRRLSVGNQGP